MSTRPPDRAAGAARRGVRGGRPRPCRARRRPPVEPAIGPRDHQQGEQDGDERVGEEVAAEGHAQTGNDRGIGQRLPAAAPARRGGKERRGPASQAAPEASPETKEQLVRHSRPLPGCHHGVNCQGPPNCVTWTGRARSQTSLKTPLTTRTGAAATVRKRKSAARAGHELPAGRAMMCWRMETSAAMPMAMVGHMLTRRRRAARLHSLIQKPVAASRTSRRPRGRCRARPRSPR